MLIMAAAVSDFKVKEPLSHKQKADTWALELTRTEDILASLGKMKGKRFIIGFALETEDIENNAREKLVTKNCNLLVVNNPLEEGAAFGHDTNAVTIYNIEGRVLSTGLVGKREIAEIILQTAQKEKAFPKILV
jgi:phosphopantothenoylcysteine decarboxylase/phosphopantothenate--cysteine ligase